MRSAIRGSIQIRCGKVVQGLQPGQDHAVVDETARVVLRREDLADAPAGQRIPDGQDVVQREEQVRAPPPGITQQAGARAHPAERQPRVDDQCLRVEHPDQGDVHEEALDREFRRAQRPVLEITGDDAGVVGPVPGLGRRLAQELHPARDRRPAGQPGLPGHEAVRFPRVAQQPFVDRAPPLAAGSLSAGRREHAPAHLPVHEGHLGPPVSLDPGSARAVVVEPAASFMSLCGIVPDRSHHAECRYGRITSHWSLCHHRPTARPLLIGALWPPARPGAVPGAPDRRR